MLLCKFKFVCFNKIQEFLSSEFENYFEAEQKWVDHYFITDKGKLTDFLLQEQRYVMRFVFFVTRFTSSVDKNLFIYIRSTNSYKLLWANQSVS